MKKLLNEWKKHLKEINEGDNSAKCASHMTHLKKAQLAHDRGDKLAFQEIQYQTEKMKALGCDMNKDYDKPEHDKPEDQIRDLATELERGLEGDMKKKATEIIDLINVHFSEGTKTPDETGERAVSDEEDREDF